MDKISLELILVVTTTVTGLVVFVHWLRTRSVAGTLEGVTSDESRGPGAVVEFSKSFFPVLLIVLIIRSFLFEPYKIPSSSMVPTLLIGDFIFVSKFSYGMRLPVIHSKIFSTGEPQRGDVAVFRLPRDPSINYIKRIIGLPGDQIEYQNRRLRINGEEIPLRMEGPLSIGKDNGTLFTESIAGREHSVLHDELRRFTPAVLVVPDDCYFVMGDNRDNSQDGRFKEVGCVPERNLVGRANRIWFNWVWGGAPRWSRIGTKIE